MGYIRDDESLGEILLGLETDGWTAALGVLGGVVDADVNGVLGVPGKRGLVGDRGIVVLDKASCWVGGIDEIEGGEEVGGVEGVGKSIGGGVRGGGKAEECAQREGDREMHFVRSGVVSLFGGVLELEVLGSDRPI